MLRVQRRLAAQVLKCGLNRVKFDPASLEEIKDAITKSDIKALINNRLISKKRLHNTSSYWTKIRKTQKSFGKQKGHGSRKGKKTARTNAKSAWISKIRLQRSFLKSLRNNGTINTTDYHELYLKSKGGFFRSLRHLKLYVTEKDVLKK